MSVCTFCFSYLPPANEGNASSVLGRGHWFAGSAGLLQILKPQTQMNSVFLNGLSKLSLSKPQT